MENLVFDKNKIDDICRKYGVDFLGLFGSYSIGNNKPDSDVDILVNFNHLSDSSLLDLVRMERDLSTVLGKKVDLVTKDSVSPYILEHVIEQLKPIYGSA